VELLVNKGDRKMNADGTFNVVIYSSEDDEVVEVIAEGKTERQADRIKNGVEINLNHDEYYVEVE
jgi:phosphotransferase system HPr-like phosphotransfer protein